MDFDAYGAQKKGSVLTVKQHIEEILREISPKALCDDCLRRILGHANRQHANHKTRELADAPRYSRIKSTCSRCKGYKLVISRNKGFRKLVLSTESTMKYLISYDLRGGKRRADREKLSKLLEKELGAVPALKSQWVVDLDKTTVKALRNKITSEDLFRKGDRLLVCLLFDKVTIRSKSVTGYALSGIPKKVLKSV